MLPAPTLVYQCPNCKNLITNLSLMSGNTKHAKLYSDGKLIAPMYPEFPDLTKCKKCDTIFWLSDLKEIGSYNDEDFLYHVSNIFRNYHNDLYDLETCECDEEKSEEEEEEENIGSEEDELQEYDTFNYEEEEYKEETEESKWYKADKAKFLNITDSFRAISLGLAKKKREEIFIRQRIWWRFNDRVRNGNEIFIDDNDKIRWKENCLTLIKLLEKKYPETVIMLADLYRNLGDFEKCLSFISNMEPDIELLNEHDKEEMKLIQEKFRSECEKKNTLVFRLY